MAATSDFKSCPISCPVPWSPTLSRGSYYLLQRTQGSKRWPPLTHPTVVLFPPFRRTKLVNLFTKALNPSTYFFPFPGTSAPRPFSPAASPCLLTSQSQHLDMLTQQPSRDETVFFPLLHSKPFLFSLGLKLSLSFQRSSPTCSGHGYLPIGTNTAGLKTTHLPLFRTHSCHYVNHCAMCKYNLTPHPNP